MISLAVNQVIEWAPFECESSIKERILFISPDQEYVYVINLQAEDFPLRRLVEDIVEAIRDKVARMINYTTLAEQMSYEDLPKERQDKIEVAWQLIRELVQYEPYIYDKKYRGPEVQKIKKLFENDKVSIPRIHRYLKRYWKSGKLKIGLVYRYDQCGNKGSTKIATKHTKKRGRKRKITKVEPEKIGINTDETVIKHFRIAFRKFHLQEKLSLNQAFRKMERTFFISHYEVDEKGTVKPRLLPREQRPMLKTFLYHANKMKNANYIGSMIEGIGERRFHLDYRAKLGNQTKSALGPGSIFHIDATIADIYLASSYRAFLPIGRPVIYSVIDVFSHMIVGLYIGFEGPSYIGAAMAIFSTGSSKVEYCRKLSFPITEEEWPVAHLPQQFTADRGEMLTKKNTGLRNFLGVDIEYTSPWRADWKALVESYFHVYNEKAIKRLPGEVSIEMRKRGDLDPREKAVLTLEEFSKIMVDLAITYNNSHWMNGYLLDEHMIAEEVKPIPRDLWLWGIKRRGHNLRAVPPDLLKMNLLPTETGRITNRGVMFKGIPYQCEQAIREGWFADGNPRMGEKLQIAFDPRYTDKVILKGYNGIGFQELTIAQPEHHAIKKTWDEFQHIEEVRDLEHEVYKEVEEQAEAERGYRRDHIVEMANIVKDETDLGSGKKVIDGIAERKAVERELNRANEHFFNDDVINDNSKTEQEKVSSGSNEGEDEVQSSVSKESTKIRNARLSALLSDHNKKLG